MCRLDPDCDPDAFRLFRPVFVIVPRASSSDDVRSRNCRFLVRNDSIPSNHWTYPVVVNKELQAEAKAFSNLTDSGRNDDVRLSSFWLVPSSVPLPNGQSISFQRKGYVVATP